MKTVRLLLVACFAGWVFIAVAPAADKKPNILFVISDDQRWDTIAALGNAQIQTPALDALVQRGFVFRNAYCMGSMIGAVCTPSRTMLMSGRSLWRIPDPKAKTYDGGSLGSVFRDAGYATLFVGKRGNSFIAGNEAFETFIYHDDPTPEKRVGSSQFMADKAIAWLHEQKSDRPFFIYLGPPVPHDPRVAPEEMMSLYDPAKLPLPANFMPQHPFDNGELRVRDELLAPFPRTPEAMRRHLADYYACITNFDRHVGRVLADLKERGQLENTVIVFTSDHGLAVGGMHGLMGKQNLYEHNKPPLILAGPGIPKGQSGALVYLFDLFPTLCAHAGLPIPPAVEGRSLLPIIRGQQPKVRETLLGAYRDCQRMIRDDRWKLIRYNATGVKNVQLFDLAADPEELRNLAAEPAHASQLVRLEKLLADARKEFGDPSDFDGL